MEIMLHGMPACACLPRFDPFTMLLMLPRVILCNGTSIYNYLQWPYPMAVAAMGMVVCWIFGYIYCDLLKMTEPVDIDMTFYMTRVFPIGAVQVRVMAVGLHDHNHSYWLGTGACHGLPGSISISLCNKCNLHFAHIGSGHVLIKQSLSLPNRLLH